MGYDKEGSKTIATSGTASSSTSPTYTVTQGAQFVFNPPSQFDFEHPEHWARWFNRFEIYRIVSGFV